jgi:hypothetical protein
MNFIVFVFSAILCTGVPAVTGAPDPAATAPDSAALVAFKKAVPQKYDMREKAFAAHDAEAILTRFYSEDPVSVGAGFGIFNGRKDLRPAYEKTVNEYTVEVTSVHAFVKDHAGSDWADCFPKYKKWGGRCSM